MGILYGIFVRGFCRGICFGIIFVWGQLIVDLHGVFKRVFKMGILNGDFLMRILNCD